MRILILLILCVACSSATKITKKLKKADKLIKEAITEGAQVKIDTVYKDKEVFLPGKIVTVQTVVKKDTIIYKDKILIKHHYKHDTLVETINCPDSLYKEKIPVSIQQTISCPPVKNRFWEGFGLGFLAVSTIFVLRKFV